MTPRPAAPHLAPDAAGERAAAEASPLGWLRARREELAADRAALQRRAAVQRVAAAAACATAAVIRDAAHARAP